MIFYFSGTGNSRWVARQLAVATEDCAVDILSLKELPDLTEEKRLGFVFPIYAWGAAQPMQDFLRRLPETPAFTYGVCTCGANAGEAMKRLSRPLDSCYSIVMPSNYIVGADVEEERVIRRKIVDAGAEIRKIAGEVLQEKKVYRVEEGLAPHLRSAFICKAFNRFARSTAKFYADDRCVGCGQCEDDCPVSSIHLENGKPVWGKECLQCLRCINACPQEAIQYGKATEQRGRYTIEKYL
jgi:NAD-dependent dihydropyrimidine dehydrogenase PreA subunit